MVYRLILDIDVVHFVFARRPAERRLLIRVFEALAADPYRYGDFQERDAEQRLTEVLRVGKYLITYWADHAEEGAQLSRQVAAAVASMISQQVTSEEVDRPKVEAAR